MISCFPPSEKMAQKTFRPMLTYSDEFHRAGARLWEGKVRHLLDSNKNAKIVGFSATPERMDGKDMRKLFNNDVASEMGLSTAIKTKLLPLPKYWLGAVEFADTVEFTQEKPGEETAKRHLESVIGLRDVFREALIPEHAEHGKFIVFCRTVKNAKRMVRESEEWFDWVDEVHRYEMHSMDRNGYGDFIRDDSESLRLLFVVDMLTEGIHIDNLDGIIMIRPTESQRVYFQQLGRALAVTTHREHPLILDIVNNAVAVRSGLDFFKGLGVELEMEEDDMDKFFHITAEAADFIARIQETEFDYYAAMKDFYEQNGHLYIPPGYTVDGHDIYHEFCMVKSRRNQLSDEYRNKYNEIGMDWEINYQWMCGFWAAQAYFEDHGDLNAPSGLGEYHGVWLYDWLKRNRERQDQLIDRQRHMLDSIGMDWTVIDPWEEKFKELVDYKEDHGHCDVPGNDEKLGYWVTKLRERPPEGDRKDRLDALGFEWNGHKARKRNAWRTGIAHSIEYFRKHENLKVPAQFVSEDGYKLGNFIKKTKRDGRMEELLNAVCA